MRMHRIFSGSGSGSGLALAGLDEFEADQRIAHYLLKVLRLREQDSVRLFDGSGYDYDATLVSATRKKLLLKIGAAHEIVNESPLHTTLAIGMGKGERMDWAVQKATELGVNCIVPLVTSRVALKLAGDRAARKLAHWRQVSISACEQCGRSCLVDIVAPQIFEAWITECRAQANASGQARMLMHADGQNFADFAETYASPGQATLLVGPEGGFTEAEIALARDSGFGAVQIGQRILRNETAPVVGLTLLQSRWGDLCGTSLSG